ncbi:PROTEIN IWS1-like protein 1 [Salix purpurea]|uniref:PROTEIN IWS1-like protein 1 n=1 Tax=Salix purpurea TaxID=77065 RepID=A0A9Q0WD04_SALPP|nr:PROTEIN IWS1-like protein 1 [Salix purpurea]
MQEIHARVNVENEDDQEGARTVDDDNFIDDSGVDPAYRYGNDIEPHSPTDAPQAEEGEEDDEIKQLFKMGKRRKKNEKSPAEIALLVENVMVELEVTAEEDADLNRQGKPAVNKLKKLPLLTEEAAPTRVHKSWSTNVIKKLATTPSRWKFTQYKYPCCNFKDFDRCMFEAFHHILRVYSYLLGTKEKDMTKDDSKRFENSLLKNLDTKLGGHLSEASSEEGFTGKPGQSMAIAAAAKNAQANNVGIVLASTGSTSNESKLNIASMIASGTVLGTYEDNKFKSDSNKPGLKSVDILGFGTGPRLDKKLKYAEDVSSAVIFGKELLNSPANVLTRGS